MSAYANQDARYPADREQRIRLLAERMFVGQFPVETSDDIDWTKVARVAFEAAEAFEALARKRMDLVLEAQQERQRKDGP